MLPIIEVPESIRQGMLPYRSVFRRQEGFDHVSRYVTGLMISPNKTLQGIYDLQVWGPDDKPTRRAMHAGVFEAGWDDDRLMAPGSSPGRGSQGSAQWWAAEPALDPIQGDQSGLDVCPS